VPARPSRQSSRLAGPARTATRYRGPFLTPISFPTWSELHAGLLACASVDVSRLGSQTSVRPSCPGACLNGWGLSKPDPLGCSHRPPNGRRTDRGTPNRFDHYIRRRCVSEVLSSPKEPEVVSTFFLASPQDRFRNADTFVNTPLLSAAHLTIPVEILLKNLSHLIYASSADSKMSDTELRAIIAREQ
jgi:hypothetical protein